jgi:hypothetical protein
VRKILPNQLTPARLAALNALKRARRAAERAGVALSEWEGEFLVLVEDRIKMCGRAFGDPGQALSMLQAVKLKEISLKAKGGRQPMARKPMMGRRCFSARSTPAVKT